LQDPEFTIEFDHSALGGRRWVGQNRPQARYGCSSGKFLGRSKKASKEAEWAESCSKGVELGGGSARATEVTHILTTTKEQKRKERPDEGHKRRDALRGANKNRGRKAGNPSKAAPHRGEPRPAFASSRGGKKGTDFEINSPWAEAHSFYEKTKPS